MTARIADHGLIGDGRSAALVTRDGTIDWLCWPRFESDAIFAGILDEERGGSWRIAPVGPARVTRRYRPGTNVLETTFETEEGRLVLTDLMVAVARADVGDDLLAEHELVRTVACTRGEVEVEELFDPRPDFGVHAWRWRDAGRFGLRGERGSRLLVHRSELGRALPGRPVRARLRAGDERRASLVLAVDAPAVLRPLGEPTARVARATEELWRRWSARLRYEGPDHALVERSALVLKLLTFTPSGSIIAAPTASLPERLGGDLNWDYRFCWLRDAAFTTRALLGLGYHDEAVAWVSWLVHATRLTRPRLSVLYDVYGEQPAPERTLDHFAGHAGSRPVRTGNAAADQLQLDVYGEVLDAALRVVSETEVFDADGERMLEQAAHLVARDWRLPDEGIWEPRTGRRPHTHSRLLAWVALDRALALRERGRLLRLDLDRVSKARAAVRRAIEERSWNRALGSYVNVPGTEELDASLLLMPAHGYLDAASPRFVSTFRCVEQALGAGPGLLYRYLNGDSPGEGAFAICSYWAATALAHGTGTLREAHDWFARANSFANDLGLMAEEVEPRTGEPLGNFPQAYTHVGVIATALALEERVRADGGLPASVEKKRRAA